MKAWRKEPSLGKGVNRKHKDQFIRQRNGHGMSGLLQQLFQRVGIQVNED